MVSSATCPTVSILKEASEFEHTYMCGSDTIEMLNCITIGTAILVEMNLGRFFSLSPGMQRPEMYFDLHYC